jgi:DNA processing protein
MPSAADDDPEELRHWLALWRIPGVGPRYFARLLAHFGSARDAISATPGDLATINLPAGLRRGFRQPDWAAVDNDLVWLEAPENSLLRSCDRDYPPLLRESDSAPPLLFVRGSSGLLSEPQLAIVGSRNPTPGGRKIAHEFAAYLAGCGLVIDSGLALGIDAAAHRGALARGAPTVAVLGTGPDRIYPARHFDLAHEIAACGALVSEFPPGTTAVPKNFPRRNRIIAGLSVGTVVVEAAIRSGSLITARLAAAQGREVFAVPGSIHSPLAKGCHALIREGAKLVEDAGGVLEELGSLVAGLYGQPVPGPADSPLPAPELDPEYLRLLEQMGHDPVSVDELVAATQLTAEEVSSMLLIMELQGRVAALAGGRYVRKG